MARLGIDYETVKYAAVKLLSQGTAPSVQKIREVIGTGSNTTIAEHLKRWREDYATKAVHHLPANMPKELISAFEVLWQTAMEQAQSQLTEYKQAVDSERESARQIQQDAEKMIADIKQQLTETLAKLAQEITEKYTLSVELAIANERLVKQEQTLVSQKNQYEERLKRVYEEKDSLILQCVQLQNELKSLQEKITSQAEQHRQYLTQQNTLHEQSEVRWLKLIDQAKQETKEASKKLENLRYHSDEALKKIKAELKELQRDAYEKNAQLKISLEQKELLKQAINLLKTENSKAQSLIIKLEEELNLKNVSAQAKKKVKKGKSLKSAKEISAE